jgi:hypothetical protein
MNGKYLLVARAHKLIPKKRALNNKLKKEKSARQEKREKRER